jgi:hypothetical protein
MDGIRKIKILDIAMAAVALVAAVISFVWISGWPRMAFTVMFGIVFLVCAINAGRVRQPPSSIRADNTPHTHIVRLLDEESAGIHDWDLEGRISALIGKSNVETTADIDLSGSIYAATVESAHAVLNFAAKNWYIEDVSLGGTVSFEKDGLQYRLTKGEPCMLTPGDIICIAGVRLMFV